MNNARRAFTFIELLIVMALIGIITGLAVVNFGRNYEQLELQQTAKDLTYLMRYAKMLAVTHQKEYQLILDTTQHQYWITEDLPVNPSDNSNQTSQTPSAPSEHPAEYWQRVQKIPIELKVKADKTSAVFHTNGAIDEISIYLCREKQCLIATTQTSGNSVETFPAELPKELEDAAKDE